MQNQAEGAIDKEGVFRPMKEIRNAKLVRCPICGNKTRSKMRPDTELKNFPLYCPKCKKETLIQAKDSKIVIIKEPDA